MIFRKGFDLNGDAGAVKESGRLQQHAARVVGAIKTPTSTRSSGWLAGDLPTAERPRGRTLDGVPSRDAGRER